MKISKYVDFINVESHGYFTPGDDVLQPYTGPNAPIYKNKSFQINNIYILFSELVDLPQIECMHRFKSYLN